MTVSLGGITLSDDLRLNGTKNQPRVIGSIRKTMGGRVVDQRRYMPGGRQLELESFRDGNSVYGHFIGSQVDQICALRDNKTVATLIHHLGTFQVLVTAVEVEDVKGVADPDGSAEYFGIVTMITV